MSNLASRNFNEDVNNSLSAETEADFKKSLIKARNERTNNRPDFGYRVEVRGTYESGKRPKRFWAENDFNTEIEWITVVFD